MKRCFSDIECYSTVPIEYGSHRYAEEATVLLWGYAIEDQPAKVWDLTDGSEMPEDLQIALEDNYEFVWHNGAMFDCIVLKHALGLNFPLDRIDDTMVRAYSHGLPGSLGVLCDIMKVPTDKAKDKDGRRLVRKFCIPDKEGKVANSKTDPEDWARFVEYCRLDVEALRELDKRLPKWNWGERDRRFFEIDQIINRRGLPIDRQLAQACVALADKVQEQNEAKAQELTNGELNSARQRDELLRILQTYGVTLPDLTKSTIERRLNDPDLPQEVKDLLVLRLSSTRASVLKYTSLLNCLSYDSRLRGTLQFRGASRTGRYAGRLFQPQNLPRPTLSQTEIDVGIEAIKGGWTYLLYEDPGELMSSCLRSVIMAPKGKKLVVADLSNIEGRMLAWLAGEEWKLDAFRLFDAGKGPDLYKATYARTFGIRPEDVTKPQRQIGKVLELAMGYQGGVGAFLAFATVYRVDLNELAKHLWESLDQEHLKASADSYDWFAERKLTHGLEREVFVALDAVKRAWRAAHPAIVRFWKETEQAAVRAITDGGTYKASKIAFDRVGGWLRLRLPSGRYLNYPGARVPEDGSAPIVFLGMNQYSRKWSHIKTFSGKLVENATQGAACDILVEAMEPIENAGFELITSIHDEFITQAPPDKTVGELEHLMSTPPVWAPDLPLAAAGFDALRYRKD